VDKLLAAGATAYMTKPIRVRDLLQTFDQIIGQPVPGRADATPVAAGAILSQPSISAAGWPAGGRRAHQH
jgi:DNA-binding response OmpR family regulator